MTNITNLIVTGFIVLGSYIAILALVLIIFKIGRRAQLENEIKLKGENNEPRQIGRN